MKTMRQVNRFRMIGVAGIMVMVAAVALSVAPANAAIISHVANGSFIDGTIDATAGGKTVTLDAGATADMLIVGTSTEFGTGGDTFTATYDGNDMVFATGNGNQSNLFYIDLTATTYSGGDANLSLSWNYTAGGDLGIGWVSAAGGDMQAGEYIALHSTGASDGSTSVDLVTTVDGTFNFVNFNGNMYKYGSASVDSPLNQIYANANFGSNAGGAGYEVDVAAGTQTYSWTHGEPRRNDAAAFTVIPEPASLGLIGLMGAILLIRRRLYGNRK